MNMEDPNHTLPVLAEVRRGAIVESVHHGALVILEPDGTVIAQLGDADLSTSTRSTIKPIQAIPFLTSGAADHFRMTEPELAIACASHEGEPLHTETVAAMLARLGLDESALRCGAHPPYHEETARALQRQGLPYTQLHNNCSGKHTGMLATAKHRGLPLDDYLANDHPIQREILRVFSRLGGFREDVPKGIDGCSAPTFGVRLRWLALAFARLVNLSSSDPESGSSSLLQEIGLEPEVAVAARRIVRAMIAHPEMVGGSERLDTDLLRTARGALICKVGAEAVYSIGILPCARFPRGLGIAIKVQDGAYRGLGVAIVETLAQLGILDASQQAELARYHKPVMKNHRGLLVGEVIPAFKL